ncbi:MAG: hypothetical protein Q4E91_03925 [Lachnospiraceae bacterium]|nr:hypothetical protein [Lachnospiraceae bacterium]
MRKNICSKTGILAAAALSTALSMQTAAFASPAEELQEIMEAQFEKEEPSLLGKTLGLSELWEEMEENGFSVELEGALSEETASLLEIEDAVPEDSSASMTLQVDPKLKKWLIQLGLKKGIDPFLDFSLYGDQDELALTLPQFFSGAVAIRSGSFKEQYEGSALQAMLEGEEPSEGEESFEIPDFDLKFYPEDSHEPGLFDLKDKIKEKAEKIQEGVQAEKTEENDKTIYTVTYQTQDIVDIYRIVMEEYLGIFEKSGLMVQNDTDSALEEIDEMLDQMSTMMGDEVEVLFTVRNNLVEKISYELYLDTRLVSGTLPEEDTEAEEETEDETTSQSLVSVDVSMEEDNFQGYLDYEVNFVDPEKPWQAFDFCMTCKDPDGNELGAFYMEKDTEETEAFSDTKIRMEIRTEGEILYSDQVAEAAFDAKTGTLDVALKMNEDDTEIALNLSGVFSDIEKGKSFLWTIHELSLESDGEKAGLQGSVHLSAEAPSFEAPEEKRMILELGNTDLMSLFSEVMIKAQTWAAQFEPETEAVDDTNDSDNALTSIIGGADGPTSVFIAGKI